MSSMQENAHPNVPDIFEPGAFDAIDVEEKLLEAFPLPRGKTWPNMNSWEQRCLAVHLVVRHNTGHRLLSTFKVPVGATLFLPCSEAWPSLKGCSKIKVQGNGNECAKKVLKLVKRSTGLPFSTSETNKLKLALRQQVAQMDIDKLIKGLEEEKKAREEGDRKLQKQIDMHMAIIKMMADRFDEQDVVVKRLNSLYNEHGLVGVSNAEHISNLQKELAALRPELESKFGAEFDALRSITDDLAAAVDESAAGSDVRKLQKLVGDVAKGLEKAKAAQEAATAESAEGLADLRKDVNLNQDRTDASIGGLQISTFQLQSDLHSTNETMAAMHHRIADLAEKLGVTQEQLASFINFMGYQAVTAAVINQQD